MKLLYLFIINDGNKKYLIITFEHLIFLSVKFLFI